MVKRKRTGLGGRDKQGRWERRSSCKESDDSPFAAKDVKTDADPVRQETAMGMGESFVKRKNTGLGGRDSQGRLKSRKGQNEADEVWVGKGHAQAKVVPAHQETAAPLDTLTEIKSNADDGDSVHRGNESDAEDAPLEFRHESILRVGSRVGVSVSEQHSEDDHQEMTGCDKPAANTNDSSDEKPIPFAANEATDVGSQQAKALAKDAKWKPFVVLRSGELFGIHYAVIRIEMPGMELSGAAWLSVLEGSVRVFGAGLDSTDSPMLVSSAPFASFILTLTPGGKATKAGDKTLRDDMTHPEALTHSRVRKAVAGGPRKLSGRRCVVLLTSVANGIEYLTSSDREQNNTDVFHSSSVYPSLCTLPGVVPGMQLLPTASIPHGPSKFPLFQEWQNSATLLQDLDTYLSDESENRSLRVLVCGASGTGKSTFTRYLVNHLLQRKTSVVLIDTDVGQPEMNPAGLLAAHVVTDFRVAAPGASTRGVPISARYLGEITPREEPDLYESYARRVISDAMEFADANGYPTVINSDGWITGVGADLLHEVAESSNPTYIVQMKFPGHAEKQSLTDICSRVTRDRWYTFTSPVGSQSTSFTASAHRDSQMASYFCKEMLLGRVYQVPLDHLQVNCVEGIGWNGPILSLLNGCVVALGSATKSNGKDEDDDCEVRGLGVVRGVDTERRVLYVSTPVPFEVLGQCDRLIQSGGVQLPHAFVTGAAAGQKSSTSASPYVLGGGIVTGNVMRSRKTLIRR